MINRDDSRPSRIRFSGTSGDFDIFWRWCQRLSIVSLEGYQSCGLVRHGHGRFIYFESGRFDIGMAFLRRYRDEWVTHAMEVLLRIRYGE